MANVTVKDIPEEDLAAIGARAASMGMSMQAYLRQMIAREAAIPLLPNQMKELMAELRATRTPMSMEEFDAIRRRTRPSA